MPVQSLARAKRKPAQPPPASITVTLDAATLPPLQYSDGARDPWKILNQGLVAVVRVAQSNDPYWALEAGKFLVDYAVREIDRRDAKQARNDAERPSRMLQPPTDRDAILAELKGLYAKALPQSLIVEAEPEDASVSDNR